MVFATVFGAKILLAVWAFREASRQRLLAPRAIAIYVLFWLVGIAIFVAVASALCQGTIFPQPLVALTAALLLPLARVGLAPLALARARDTASAVTSNDRYTMKPLATPVIEVNNFGKNYGGFAAVRDLSFAMRPGEIVGLVGANGAGKTTTLRAISGILRPTTGTVRIGGRDIEKEPVAAKQQFAYIPDTIHPYDLLTVTEHLHFIALAYRVENAEAKYDALLDELELADKKHEPASNLSRGMLQKLSLACAFLREPSVILLDEPLTGLDPRGIRNIKESIRRRAAAGTAFLLSSHLLLLVEALCDQVMILHRGQKMASGSLAEIRNLASLQADASLEDVFFAVTEKTKTPAALVKGL